MEAVGEAAPNGYVCVMVALSILDLSPVTTATPPAAALNNTLDLARFADTARLHAATGSPSTTTCRPSQAPRPTS